MLTELKTKSGEQVDFDELFRTQPLADTKTKFEAELSEFTGRSGKTSTLFEIMCVSSHIYEYPTTEYIEGLAEYLVQRAVEIAQLTDETPRILEVAAGQGRLSYLLSLLFNAKGQPAKFYAVDDFSWNHSNASPSVAEKMDAFSALEKYQPHVVLASWMPSEPGDWTAAFRATPSVEEYLLIGNPDRHANKTAWESSRYKPDGFDRHNLTWLEPYQLCWQDCIVKGGLIQRSRTVAFTKKHLEPEQTPAAERRFFKGASTAVKQLLS